ncbi:MAG TPA: rhomboid family intramembrane serine protease [Solirubrobacteraceae bacterium]|nr:rhomboid family intramembrane serine protease [Solirubrobacteraceae bacterium]
MLPLRDENPTRRVPVVTILLIVANVAVYFLVQPGNPNSSASARFNLERAAIPCEVVQGRPLSVGEVQATYGAGDDPACEGDTQQGPPLFPGKQVLVAVFVSMFLHGSLLHLGGNMLFMWIFGNNVEDSMGPLKYILFYLAGGVAADALQIVFDLDSNVPTLGASGAVAAVLGGYILIYPRARVITVIFIVIFFTVIELPALLVLGLWFAQQVAFGLLEYGTADQGGGGVAYFAHIGGFVFGLLAIRLLATNIKDVAGRRRPERT